MKKLRQASFSLLDASRDIIFLGEIDACTDLSSILLAKNIHFAHTPGCGWIGWRCIDLVSPNVGLITVERLDLFGRSYKKTLQVQLAGGSSKHHYQPQRKKMQQKGDV